MVINVSVPVQNSGFLPETHGTVLLTRCYLSECLRAFSFVGLIFRFMFPYYLYIQHVHFNIPIMGHPVIVALGK